jgi:hypothetical protein
MSTLLRTIGQNFRLVGPLTLTNWMRNPNLLGLTGAIFDNWTSLNGAFGVINTLATTFATLEFNSVGSSQKRGMTYLVSDPVQQETTYYLSLEASLPFDSTGNGIPVPFKADVTYLGSTVGTETYTFFLTGTLNNAGYTRGKIQFTVPVDTTQVSIDLYFQSAGVLPRLALRKIMLSDKDIAYVDGQTAGYVWSDTPNNSTTLKSTVPAELRMFTPTRISVTD